MKKDHSNASLELAGQTRHSTVIPPFLQLCCGTGSSSESGKSGTHRNGCAGDSAVESHAKRNRTHVSAISVTGTPALLPLSDFGREYHPPDLWNRMQTSEYLLCCDRASLKGYLQESRRINAASSAASCPDTFAATHTQSIQPSFHLAAGVHIRIPEAS